MPAPWYQAIVSWLPLYHAPINFYTPPYYPGAPYWIPPYHSRGQTCYVEPPPDGGDAAPAILDAFLRCGQNGRVIFAGDTDYYIKSVMSTTGLSNVEVDIRGNLIWSTDIQYWLNHSLPVGYQNQSTAWIFGGDQIWMHGDGVGTFNGSGQVWYDFTYGKRGNYPKRPHQITFNNLTNSVIEGLHFWQSQMWTMTLINSHRVLLQDIKVNSTDLRTGGFPINTDGADTLYSKDIAFARWIVQNGDDAIAIKENSTNILIENCTFIEGSGIALGSIGQYPNTYTDIINVTARDISLTNSHQGVYIKTWTGRQKGYPPNGGGGGTGLIRNITFDQFRLKNVFQSFYITQCLSYIGATGDCDTSTFKIEDFTWSNVQGTQIAGNVTAFQCSKAAPCTGITLQDVNLRSSSTGKALTGHSCCNVEDPIGFTCDSNCMRND